MRANTWPRAAWLHRASASRESLVIAVQPGDVIELNGLGQYVAGVEPDALLLRPEQPADVWCGAGEPPPIRPEEPTRISRADLVDARGHLGFRPKYLKGC